MTDALAQWFLQEVEAGRRPWEKLASAQSAPAFAALVNELREAGELRNDDTTLLSIHADQP